MMVILSINPSSVRKKFEMFITISHSEFPKPSKIKMYLIYCEDVSKPTYL